MQKIKYLDGLRGVAAFIVVLSHYMVGFYPASYTGRLEDIRAGHAIDLLVSGTPLNVLYGGNFAVTIFFILSGYVLTYRFFTHGGREIVISSAVRRYFRLLFPILFSMFIAYSFMTLHFFYNPQASTLTTSTWLSSHWNFDPNLIDMLKQAFVGVFLFENHSTYNSPAWTMTYEFYGSFLVFGLVYLFGNLKKRYIIYAVLILLSINTYYLAFILGVVLSDLYNGKYNKFKDINILKNKIIIGLFLSIGLFLGSYPPGRDVNNTIYNFMNVDFIGNPVVFYHIIGSFFVMLALLNSNKLKSALSNNIIYFLGKISFSMYLIHLIILSSFSSYLFIKLTPYFSYNVNFIITFCSSTILIIIISYLMYKYVDEKGIHFSYYVHNKIRKSFVLYFAK